MGGGGGGGGGALCHEARGPNLEGDNFHSLQTFLDCIFCLDVI